ncbi:MAG: DMT family transporter [Novosphingobium sp.]
MTKATGHRHWSGWHFAALLGGNAALALGPLWVRMADSGPVSAGFWRLFLALPAFIVLARLNGQRLTGHSRGAMLAIVGAGLFFSLDLASWHLGIERTRLGNATLFGNSGSIILVAVGLITLRRAPRPTEWLAFAAAILGSVILLGRSLEIGTDTLVGDLLCLLAGFLYTFYILLAQRARNDFGSWTVLVYATFAGLPVLLGTALYLGEPVWPHHWGPLIALALTSQVIGQGLLVYALRHFSPFIVGLVLLTQPAISVLVGWVKFGEVLSPLDGLGMLLVGAGLVLARSTQD